MIRQGLLLDMGKMKPPSNLKVLTEVALWMCRSGPLLRSSGALLRRGGSLTEAQCVEPLLCWGRHVRST